jgi:predicted nicotinamide N-methyase
VTATGGLSATANDLMPGDVSIVETSASPNLEPWLIAQVQFVLGQTQIGATPLVPEIALRLGSESILLWDRIEQAFDAAQVGPPYWAFAWAGGQALARYLLDNPGIVTGRRVLDLASGSGIAGLAAKKAGAAHVINNDVDQLAAIAIALNAQLNALSVEVNTGDLLAVDVVFNVANVDVVLVGDGFYDHALSPRVMTFVQRCRRAGALVLIGDPGRMDLPIEQLTKICDYAVPVTKGNQYTAAAEPGEEKDLRRAAVWSLNLGELRGK